MKSMSKTRRLPETGINLTRLTKEEMRGLRRRLQIIFRIRTLRSTRVLPSVRHRRSDCRTRHVQKGTKELENYVIDIMGLRS